MMVNLTLLWGWVFIGFRCENVVAVLSAALCLCVIVRLSVSVAFEGELCPE